MSENKGILELVKRYEQTVSENKSVYFDADQFCDIADYYDRIGDMESARGLLNTGLQIHPDNDQLLIKKAKLFAYDNDYQQALHLLNIVSSGYDFDLYMLKVECLLQLSEYEETINLVEAILENEEADEMHTVLADLGFLYVEADHFEEAANFFEESLNIEAENTEVLIDLSYAYEMLGDFENAINATNKVLDVDSYNYDAWINLGKLYSLEENYEKAVDAFDFALTINDGDTTILKLKAHCLSLSGRPLDAIIIFKEVLKETPEDTTLYLLLSECHASLELFNEALECLLQYKELEGETIEYFTKEASLLFQMDKVEQALAVIQRAMKIFGSQLDLLILSGDIKLAIEQHESAEKDFKEAYLLESDNFEILDKLALISIKTEEYVEAIKFAEELLILEPDNNLVKQRLALLYLEIDNKEKFNEILDSFEDEEIMELFKLFYTPKEPELFDREQLIASLNEAREYRTLFKNLKY